MSVEPLQALRQQVNEQLESLRSRLTSPALAEPTSPAARALRRQVTLQIAKLEQELATAGAEGFEMSFAEVKAPDSHSIGTTVLANLLSRFQRAITFAGWARLSGPGVSGDPPRLISRALETQVDAFAYGSFVVELSPHETALEHLALEAALGDFLAIAEVGTEAELEVASDRLAPLTHDLGGEATRRLALFFAKLHEAQLDARFQWTSSPETHVSIRPEQARLLSKWLKNVEQDFESVPVRGVLTAADQNGGRFAITDELGQLHEGRAAPELLSRAVIDAPYLAQIRVTTFKSTATGEVTERGVLESLEPLTED